MLEAKLATEKAQTRLLGAHANLYNRPKPEPRNIEKDMVFELMKQHLVEDDDELNKIYDNYKSGKMTSGELKEIACSKMEEFMNKFVKGAGKARKNIDKLKFVKFKQ